MRTSAIWATIVSTSLSMEVQFFYSNVVDRCSYQGTSITANENALHGGVCAYAPGTASLYACPAPDPNCWGWAQKCNDGAVGQVVCNRGGTVFCCNSVAGESCTTTPGQINICISNFTSPNSGISKDVAYSKYLAALGLSTITATSQTITPSPFSTLNPSKTPTTSSTSTTSSSVSTPTSTFPSSTFLLMSPSSTPSSYGFSSSSATAAHISPGAIAGIVVGVLAGLAILFGVIFVYRRQLRKRNQERNLHEASKENASTPLAYAENNEKVGLRNHTPSELDSERTSRVELPVSQDRGRFEMP